MATQNPTHTDMVTPQARKGAGDILDKDALQEKVREVQEDAQNLYQRGKEGARHAYERSRDRALEWEDDFEHYVQEQPLKAVFIAAGVGLVLGMLIARR